MNALVKIKMKIFLFPAVTVELKDKVLKVILKVDFTFYIIQTDDIYLLTEL